MRLLKSSELRKLYLDFFREKGHAIIPSASLIPENDPTVLFTTAGMHPLVPYLMGAKHPEGTRLADVQKCIRTGDIDEVGDTSHCTFFEMLGNWSLGDYFKKESIAYSWEFLTSDKWLGIDKDKLYFTCFAGDADAPRDTYSHDRWVEMGVDPSHIFYLDKKHNWWGPAGITGPCGPDTEMFIIKDQPPCGPNCSPACSCGRFLEIWNDVFMQYNKTADGQYVPMAKKNVDTGMGLERTVCTLNGCKTVYETDAFTGIIAKISELSGKHYDDDEATTRAFRIVADHLRTSTFIMGDPRGVSPSNVDQGYVLRRLLRRAARHGRMLGIDHPFLTDLVDTVIISSEVGYPELREHESYIKKVIGTEEERFYKTIDSGMNILNGMIQHLHETHKKILSGLDVFKLNDTFGFPIDLTKEIAAEAGLGIDEAAFHVEMTRQRERARAERLAKDISGWSEDLFGELNAEPTEFDGYDVLKETAKVLALSDGEELNDAVSTDYEERENVLVVLDRTPFYAEMGGQVADHGYLTSGTANLKVNQVKKTPKGFYVHTCTLLDGTIRVGDTVTAAVDEQRRASICRNHTATHLMQKALREVLGEHVHQAGSYQDDKITRFDFTHFNAVTPEELVEVEKRVNEKIFAALPVTIQNLPIEEAKKMGAMALFGEKYGKVVRVVDIEGWSTEFCGGTHVKNTAQIGCFKILSEASVAAGIRRIEATTGYGVLNLLDDRTAELANTAVALKANNMKDVAARAQAVTAELKEANKQLEIAKAKLASSQIDGLFQNAVEVDGVRIVTVYLNGTTPDTLRSMMDKLRDKEPNAVGALIGTDGSKTTLAVGVGKNALARGLKAGALVKQIAAIAGGNGGGKPDFAMAGIRDTSKIDDALNAVEGIVKESLEKAN